MQCNEINARSLAQLTAAPHRPAGNSQSERARPRPANAARPSPSSHLPAE
ncbi:hypothetical protein M3J09_002354 [Ascochyta lentis]